MKRHINQQNGTKFVIKERGKKRNITTNIMVDKTVNHLLCDEVLSSEISPFLIYDNGASQKNKGVAFSRKRLEVHLHKYYREHKSNDGYILLMDFSGYYSSIPYKKCLQVMNNLLRNVNNEERAMTMWILQNIFQVFSIESNRDRGINIGSQPSQNIGIAYPSRIDNYIKIVKGCKYYGRYTDDSYIIHESKEFLNEVLAGVLKIADKLELVINPKKTYIAKLSQTFKFLQLKYSLTETGRIVRRINPKAITRQQQITNMSQLYYDLFKEVPKWKNHGKLRYLMEQNLKTLD